MGMLSSSRGDKHEFCCYAMNTGNCSVKNRFAACCG